jgi:hypothetical protein
MDFPETPEAVALALLDRVLDRSEPERGTNKPRWQEILALYAECLAAVDGDRRAARAITH